ncbi:hypothetical protein [Kaistia granuli]|uniref:hypothetical protein n=1 Tax=Kaistia granuli TaxID=363259 RepID=UPI000361F57D|nr:hypothetical protein [Kaistia granuli]
MSAFDRAAIMREAHATARRSAKPGQYRETFAWALRNAWDAAKKLAGFRAIWAAQTPAERQRIDAAMAIEAKDRLSHSDRHRLAELRAA